MVIGLARTGSGCTTRLKAEAKIFFEVGSPLKKVWDKELTLETDMANGDKAEIRDTGTTKKQLK